MPNAASNVAVSATETLIFKGACSAFKVGCRAASPNEVFVRIPNLHGRSSGFPIFPGGEEEFEIDGVNAITEVYAKSAGDSTIDYGVTGKTA